MSTDISDAQENQVSKAISFLKASDLGQNHSLTAKIEFLEKKGIPSNDILESIKSISNVGLLHLKSSSKQISKYSLLNKSLPWLFVIGVGFATYYLTGEDEEENVSLTQPGNVANPEMIEQSKLDMLQSSSETDSTEPEWAKKLMLGFVELSEEVKRLKEKSHHIEQYADNYEQQQQIIRIPLEDRLERLHQAVVFIQQLYRSAYPPSVLNGASFASFDDSGVVSDEGKLACTSLIMYFKTALENPAVPRYRRIAIENQRFKSSLHLLLNTLYPSTVTDSHSISASMQSQQQHQQQPGVEMSSGKGHKSWTICDEIMACVGFFKRGMYYEWHWMSDSSDSSQLSSSVAALDSPEITTINPRGMSTQSQPSKAQAPAYRFSPSYASFMDRKNSSNAPKSSTNSSGGADTAESESDTDELPDHSTASTLVQQCMNLLGQVKSGSDITALGHFSGNAASVAAATAVTPPPLHGITTTDAAAGIVSMRQPSISSSVIASNSSSSSSSTLAPHMMIQSSLLKQQTLTSPTPAPTTHISDNIEHQTATATIAAVGASSSAGKKSMSFSEIMNRAQSSMSTRTADTAATSAAATAITAAEPDGSVLQGPPSEFIDSDSVL